MSIGLSSERWGEPAAFLTFLILVLIPFGILR